MSDNVLNFITDKAHKMTIYKKKIFSLAYSLIIVDYRIIIILLYIY